MRFTNGIYRLFRRALTSTTVRVPTSERGGHRHSKFAFGIDGVIGLEYKIPSIPLAFSLDYKPNLNLIEKTKFHALDFGLGVKVTFDRRSGKAGVKIF